MTLSDCLFNVAIMVSKDLSMTSISGVKVVFGSVGGSACGGGEGGRPRPQPRPLRV